MGLLGKNKFAVNLEPFEVIALYSGGKLNINGNIIPTGTAATELLNCDMRNIDTAIGAFLDAHRNEDYACAEQMLRKANELIFSIPPYCYVNHDDDERLFGDGRHEAESAYHNFVELGFSQDHDPIKKIIAKYKFFHDDLRLFEKNYSKWLDRLYENCDSKDDLMRRLHNENAFMYHPSIDTDERKPARPTVEFYVSDGVLYEKTVFDNLLDFVFVDMLRGMVVGHFPKRCANCHRWFLQEDSYKYEYCGKPSPQNPSMTCREIGAQESFLHKVKMNPVWNAYQRGYKKYYARVLKKTWTKAQFLEWQEHALELREKALNGELDPEEFARMINES